MTTASEPVLGARALARAEMTRQILDEARRQLADVGAASLSLRAVARELGLVSSAIYRFFASRDELLTMLIVEAYDDLGTRAEAAAAGDGSPRNRWVAVARAVRDWALEHPEQYALLYGSPVPGYAAPDVTVGPGTRVSLALVAIAIDAAAETPLMTERPTAVPASVARDLDRVRQSVDLGSLPDHTVAAVIAAWTGMFGLLSFELFGQTRGIVEDHGAMFDTVVGAGADAIGLTD